MAFLINQLLSSTPCCKFKEYICRVKIEFTLNEIEQVAVKFLNAVGSKKVFAFHGNMGAGKTTFIHALCEKIGVKDIVSSPTFSIINEYAFLENGIQKKIYHIDLYRLKDEEEAIRAGVEDCIYSDHLCFVEWPDKAPCLFPDETVHVSIELIGESTRRLNIADN
jgi:tRNA threonylcarbamoyladenosine biosynthesis protein TsaE